MNNLFWRTTNSLKLISIYPSIHQTSSLLMKARSDENALVSALKIASLSAATESGLRIRESSSLPSWAQNAYVFVSLPDHVSTSLHALPGHPIYDKSPHRPCGMFDSSNCGSLPRRSRPTTLGPLRLNIHTCGTSSRYLGCPRPDGIVHVVCSIGIRKRKHMEDFVWRNNLLRGFPSVLCLAWTLFEGWC
jgi:hypothetical protein